jgi:hypothetical protein
LAFRFGFARAWLMNRRSGFGLGLRGEVLAMVALTSGHWPRLVGFMGAGTLGAMGLLFLGVALFPWQDAKQTPSAAQPSASHAQLEWQAVEKPLLPVSIDMPEWKGLSRSYEARRHARTRLREDVVAIGQPASQGLYARFVIARSANGEALPGGSFYLDVTRRAAQAGLAVIKSDAPSSLDTKLGPFEMAETEMVTGSVQRSCFAFRGPEGETGIRMTGFVCGTAERKPDPRQLTCLIDRLEPAADDRAVRDLFRGSEIYRNAACRNGKVATSQKNRVAAN